jgi:hypothetical protein
MEKLLNDNKGERLAEQALNFVNLGKKMTSINNQKKLGFKSLEATIEMVLKRNKAEHNAFQGSPAEYLYTSASPALTSYYSGSKSLSSVTAAPSTPSSATEEKKECEGNNSISNSQRPKF